MEIGLATPQVIRLDQPLCWQNVVAISEGARLVIQHDVRIRVEAARAIVDAIVARGMRAYGVNTGVGALCNVVIDVSQLRQLSRNLLMSHACGVGDPLSARAVRAIIAAAINNMSHGLSGVRPEVLDHLVAFLDAGCVPEVPGRGSVGYLTHMAHISLVLIGEGAAWLRGERISGATALRSLDLPPLVLEAKEGLSLINGTPCATGLAAVALARTQRLLDWADGIAAMTFENLYGQPSAFDKEALSARPSPGLTLVGKRMREFLEGSKMVAATDGLRTQDALSLRAVPHVHGAARDTFAHAAETVDRELAAATDNPLVAGSPEEPRVLSEAHAVGASIGLAMDSLATAVAEIGAMSERRLDRLVNPLVSGLPAFLAARGGACSGFMIAQYSAVSLVAQNRRLASPASLDGGVTSALQEDHLCHATPAAFKLLEIIDNAEHILATEWLGAAQAYDLQPNPLCPAPRTEALYRTIRAVVRTYSDDRPLAGDMQLAHDLISKSPPP